MYRSDGAIILDKVCRCENPKLKIVGYWNFPSEPIYLCRNCGHHFKSRSAKWLKFVVKKEK